MTGLMLLLLLVSPAVGSFLGVLVDRLPRGEDVFVRRSACRACDTPLGLLDFIPLVSYFALSGRCRTCHAAIPKMTVVLESGALAIAFLVVWGAKSDLQMVLGVAWLWCLLALAACDVRWMRLPDALSLALLVFGMGLAFEDPTRSAAMAGIAALAGSAVFLAIRWGYSFWRGREGLGLGDVKVMLGIGAGVGLEALPMTVLLAALGALVWGGVSAVATEQTVKATQALPFGAFLAGAGGAMWLWIAL